MLIALTFLDGTIFLNSARVNSCLSLARLSAKTFSRCFRFSDVSSVRCLKTERRELNVNIPHFFSGVYQYISLLNYDFGARCLVALGEAHKPRAISETKRGKKVFSPAKLSLALLKVR